MTRKNPLIEVLENITWNMPPESREGITIVITHRGARNDIKAIAMDEVSRFDRGYIYISKQEGEKGQDYDEEVPIPLHRVRSVLDPRGNVLYQKGKGEKEEPKYEIK